MGEGGGELPFGNGAAVPWLGAQVEVVKNLADSDAKVCGPVGCSEEGFMTHLFLTGLINQISVL